MKSIKRDINNHVNDSIVKCYNKTDATPSICKKVKLINKLRTNREFGHFMGQGFVEAARQYFDKF